MTTRKYKRRHTWRSSLKKRKRSQEDLRRRKRRARRHPPLEGGSNPLTSLFMWFLGLFSGSGGNDTVTNVLEASGVGAPGEQARRAEQPEAPSDETTRAVDNIDFCRVKSLTVCGRSEVLLNQLKQLNIDLKEEGLKATNQEKYPDLEVLVLVSDILVKWLEEHPREKGSSHSDIEPHTLYKDVRIALEKSGKVTDKVVEDISKFYSDSNYDGPSFCDTERAKRMFEEVSKECNAVFFKADATDAERQEAAEKQLSSLKEVYLTILCCIIQSFVTDKWLSPGAGADASAPPVPDAISPDETDADTPTGTDAKTPTETDADTPTGTDAKTPTETDANGANALNSENPPAEGSSDGTSAVDRGSGQPALTPGTANESTATDLSFVKTKTPEAQLEFLGSLVKSLYFAEGTYARCCISRGVPDSIHDRKMSKEEAYVEYIGLLQGVSCLESLLNTDDEVKADLMKFTKLAASSNWTASSPDKIAFLLRSAIRETSIGQDKLNDVKDRIGKLTDNAEVKASDVLKRVLETTLRDLEKPDLPVNEFVSPLSAPCLLVQWTQQEGKSCSWKEKMLAALGKITAAGALRKLSKWYNTVKKAQKNKDFASVPDDYQTITNLFAYIGTLDSLCGSTIDKRDKRDKEMKRRKEKENEEQEQEEKEEEQEQEQDNEEKEENEENEENEEKEEENEEKEENEENEENEEKEEEQQQEEEQEGGSSSAISVGGSAASDAVEGVRRGIAEKRKKNPARSLEHICPESELVFKKYAMRKISDSSFDEETEAAINKQLSVCSSLLIMCQRMPIAQDTRLLFAMFKLDSKAAEREKGLGTVDEDESGGELEGEDETDSKSGGADKSEGESEEGDEPGEGEEPEDEPGEGEEPEDEPGEGEEPREGEEKEDNSERDDRQEGEIGAQELNEYIQKLAAFCETADSNDFGFLNADGLQSIAQRALFCLNHAFKKSAFYTKLSEEQKEATAISLPLKYDEKERVFKLWKLVNDVKLLEKVKPSCGQIVQRKVVWEGACMDAWLDGRDNELMGEDDTDSKYTCGISNSKSESNQLLQFLLFGKMVKGLMYFHNLLKIKVAEFGKTEKAANLVLNEGTATFPSEGPLLTINS